MNNFIKVTIIAFLLISLFLLLPANAFSAGGQQATTLFRIGMDKAGNPQQVSVVVQIFLILTVLSLAPAILIMMTSFIRIAIVLSLLRQALGTHTMPANQIITGLALFLTFFIMQPVWQNINKTALQPFLSNKISQEQAFKNAMSPVRKFMARQTREKDLALFAGISKIKRPKSMDDIPVTVLIPAFVISELKTAFQIGFLLYVPFLVIDMVVASVLLSMGMMMLPPVMVSLPFKLMIFVLVDGWYLIVGSIVKSFA